MSGWERARELGVYVTLVSSQQVRIRALIYIFSYAPHLHIQEGVLWQLNAGDCRNLGQRADLGCELHLLPLPLESWVVRLLPHSLQAQVWHSASISAGNTLHAMHLISADPRVTSRSHMGAKKLQSLNLLSLGRDYRTTGFLETHILCPPVLHAQPRGVKASFSRSWRCSYKL